MTKIIYSTPHIIMPNLVTSVVKHYIKYRYGSFVQANQDLMKIPKSV